MRSHEAQSDKPVAIVTGASSGIGLEIAKGLAQRGYDLALVARNPERLRHAAESCQRSGVDVLVVEADLAESDAPDRVIAQIRARFGRIDALVNNAGSNLRKATVDYRDEDIQRLFALLAIAPLTLSRVAAPLLFAAPHAAVLNISSVAALGYVGSGVVYAAAKAALDNLTRYLAVEWAPRPAAAPDGPRPGVRVNAILPGYIDTPLAAPVLSDSQRLDTILRACPMQRVGTPGEVAALAVFLLSADASYITGQTIAVDGGTSAQVLPPPTD
jgi:tropinone reductase I